MTRILIYEEGTDDETIFAEDADSVPAVGDNLQMLNRAVNEPSRGPMFEVIKREWYSTHYAGSRYVVEAALTVRAITT